EGALRVLINVTSGPDLTLNEANEAAQLINQLCDRREANIIFGWVSDQEMEGQVRVTVLATGFSPKNQPNIQSNVAANVDTPAVTARSLETPSIQRVPQPQTSAAPGEAAEPESPAVKTLNESDLDIPAFLRRR